MYTWTWLYIVFIIVFSIMLGVLNDEGEAYEGDGAENDGGDGAESRDGDNDESDDGLRTMPSL